MVKEFPTFFGTKRFITIFTTVCNLSLNQVNTDCASISFHLYLDLPSSLVSSGYFFTKMLYIFFYTIQATFPTHHILEGNIAGTGGKPNLLPPITNVSEINCIESHSFRLTSQCLSASVLCHSLLQQMLTVNISTRLFFSYWWLWKMSIFLTIWYTSHNQ